MSDPIVDLGLSCPKAGRFYICEDQPTRFVGCCTIDPCATADGLCPDDHLQPSSFSPGAYSKILAQDCLDPGFLWYTCRDSSPPFLGCCSQMACEASGCPVSKVGAASLAGNKQQAAPFLSGGSAASSRASSASSSSSEATGSSASAPSTTLSTALLSTAASTTGGAPTHDSTQPAAVSRPAHPGLSKGAIAGIAVGVIAVGCALAGLLFWWLKQHKKRPSDNTTHNATADGSSRGKDEYPYGGKDSLAEHRGGRLLGVRADATGRGGGAGAGQIPQAEPSPGLESVISELPATPSQQSSITSGATPGRPIVSMASSSGVTGRESDASGYTAKPQSPLVHQTLFELEDSSTGRAR